MPRGTTSKTAALTITRATFSDNSTITKTVVTNNKSTMVTNPPSNILDNSDYQRSSKTKIKTFSETLLAIPTGKIVKLKKARKCVQRNDDGRLKEKCPYIH